MCLYMRLKRMQRYTLYMHFKRMQRGIYLYMRLKRMYSYIFFNIYSFTFDTCIHVILPLHQWYTIKQHVADFNQNVPETFTFTQNLISHQNLFSLIYKHHQNIYALLPLHQKKIYLITKRILCTAIALKEDLPHHQNICHLHQRIKKI